MTRPSSAPSAGRKSGWRDPTLRWPSPSWPTSIARPGAPATPSPSAATACALPALHDRAAHPRQGARGRRADAAALVELEAILEVSPKDVQCHRLAAEVHRRRGPHRRPPWSTSRARSASIRATASRARCSPCCGPRAGRRRGRPAWPRFLSDDTFATVTFGALCLGAGLRRRGRAGVHADRAAEPGTSRPASGWRGAATQAQRRKG